MRFDIRYRTSFVYDEPVRESHNELRACPAHTSTTWLLGYRLEIWPDVRVQSFVDYWGTRVDSFGLREAHTELEVVAHGTVQTSNPPAPAGVRLEEVVARAGPYELLAPTRHTSWTAGMRREALSVVDGLGGGEGTGAVDAVRAIQRHVHQRLSYEPGVTGIQTTAGESWQAGAGVCQDYSHVTIALLRSLAIPSRYVSGYLFTLDEASGDAAAVPEGLVEVQTHAWVEAMVGPGEWLGVDPTGGVDVGARHVKIGHGREYDDVTPFHGTYRGHATAELTASVEMERLGESGPSRPRLRQPASRRLRASVAGRQQ
jgi:transglutaminase-like putative cysteine protease